MLKMKHSLNFAGGVSFLNVKSFGHLGCRFPCFITIWRDVVWQVAMKICPVRSNLEFLESGPCFCVFFPTWLGFSGLNVWNAFTTFLEIIWNISEQKNVPKSTSPSIFLGEQNIKMHPPGQVFQNEQKWILLTSLERLLPHPDTKGHSIS